MITIIAQWRHPRESSEPSELWMRRAIVCEPPRKSMTDIYHYENRLRRYVFEMERSGLEASRSILWFIRRREIEGVGFAQLVKYMIILRQFFTFIGKAAAALVAEDVEDYIYSLRGMEHETKRTKFMVIRKFLSYIGKEDIVHLTIHMAHSKLPIILTKEEVERMADAVERPDKKLLILLLYESGCRIGELMSLRVGSIMFDEHGAVLLVEGKTGQRRVRVIRCAPLLRSCIERLRPDDRLFYYGWANVRKILEEAKEKAGIEKKVYPHLFRHSRATALATKLTEAQLDQHFGWSIGSRMAAVYVHLSGRDLDDAIIKAEGLNPDSEE